MKYDIIHTNRKTMALYIRNDGRIEVRAPQNINRNTIEAFVRSKQDWIYKKLQLTKQNMLLKETHQLSYGDEIYYLGQPYPIYGREGNRIGFQQGFYVPYELSKDEIKDAVIQVYKLLAKNILQNKVQYYAQLMQVSPSSIRVNSAKTRWGSCSSKRGINFSWRLIMADESVVDYVVVHELSHLKEMNHSKQFWAIVEMYLPAYKEEKKKLKALEQRLRSEVWD